MVYSARASVVQIRCRQCNSVLNPHSKHYTTWLRWGGMQHMLHIISTQQLLLRGGAGPRKTAAQREEESLNHISEQYNLSFLSIWRPVQREDIWLHFKGKRDTHTHTCKYDTHTRLNTQTGMTTPAHVPHIPSDPLGQGLSTVSPFRVGGHWTPRATRPSHPPTWPGPPGAMGTRRGGRGVRGTIAVIGLWSNGPRLMTPTGWEADGRTGVNATVAVYERTVVIREERGPRGMKVPLSLWIHQTSNYTNKYLLNKPLVGGGGVNCSGYLRT